jgi:hypothetical protein
MQAPERPERVFLSTAKVTARATTQNSSNDNAKWIHANGRTARTRVFLRLRDARAERPQKAGPGKHDRVPFRPLATQRSGSPGGSPRVQKPNEDRVWAWLAAKPSDKPGWPGVSPTNITHLSWARGCLETHPSRSNFGPVRPETVCSGVCHSSCLTFRLIFDVFRSGTSVPGPRGRFRAPGRGF